MSEQVVAAVTEINQQTLVASSDEMEPYDAAVAGLGFTEFTWEGGY